MSDRSSAGIFAKVFEYLAEDGTPKAKAFAKQLYDEDRGEYDFSAYQMGCDEALMKLGLACQCLSCGSMLYHDNDKEDHGAGVCTE